MTRPDFCHQVLFYDDADGWGELCRSCGPAWRPTSQCSLPSDGRMPSYSRASWAPTRPFGFTAMEELGRNPARIIPFWRGFADEHGGRDRPIRGIGEPIWPGRSADEIDECQRHESLLNYAFGSAACLVVALPVRQQLARQRCPRGSRSLPSLHRPRRDERREPGPQQPHGAAFRGHPPGPPRRRGNARIRPQRAGSRSWPGRSGSGERAALVGADQGRGHSRQRAGGEQRAAWRRARNAANLAGPGSFVAEIEDSGQISEPLAGRVRPEPTQTGGRGLWLANQLCDLTQIRSGPQGTSIRLRMSLA